MGDNLVKPHEFSAKLNGQEYLQFLQNELLDLLEDFPPNTRTNMRYQHNGTPVYFNAPIQNYLNNTCLYH